MLKTESKVQQNEDEKILKLHFYDEYIDPRRFASNIEHIYESYEIMCNILNISINEYPVKVIKIESGSFLGKFLGKDLVMDALSFFIKKVIELLFNKYTFEGKILRHKQILDLLKEDLEVCEKYKELGCKVDLHQEEFNKYHYQLLKSICELTAHTTKIKVDDKEFRIESNLKHSYIKASEILLLEEKGNANDIEKN